MGLLCLISPCIFGPFKSSSLVWPRYCMSSGGISRISSGRRCSTFSACWRKAPNLSGLGSSSFNAHLSLCSEARPRATYAPKPVLAPKPVPGRRRDATSDACASRPKTGLRPSPSSLRSPSSGDVGMPPAMPTRAAPKTGLTSKHIQCDVRTSPPKTGEQTYPTHHNHTSHGRTSSTGMIGSCPRS